MGAQDSVIKLNVLHDFFKQGFVLVKGVEAVEDFLSAFIGHFNELSDLPFAKRILLDNVARIPHKTCQDAVETGHLSLHFEMGLPLLPIEDAARVHALICLHIPLGDHASDVSTRLLSSDGLCSGFSAKEVESRLITYVQKHGAGWQEFNSGRLLCAAQLLDAVHQKDELGYMREDRIAEWFNKDGNRSLQDGESAEREFFAKCGIDLSLREKSFVLQPGDLLIIDNLRVAHGRKGKRPAEELVQYLYGVKDASKEEIMVLRNNLAGILSKVQ